LPYARGITRKGYTVEPGIHEMLMERLMDEYETAVADRTFATDKAASVNKTPSVDEYNAELTAEAM
jgi:hypothetical protein